MKQKTKFEMWVGALVVMTFGALLMIALQVSNFSALKETPSYQISALFNNIGGLKVRAPVKLSGVVIGRVTNITIDQKTFKARVWMDVDRQYNELSLDSSASILTSGLLGDQYIGITPGGDMEYLEDGSEIEYTQSALVLEELIGQFLVKFTESGD
ncbi:MULTISPECIES: outer membrane lipid asymmetry maintenance protein MlaD [Thiomicrorhabdus]|uniref:Outer membrane lipid asymmetry maintenance protein MlaD n=1 Tax=Thiomicrorhabdus xiamenensis TaxID=2739063 RepID=A0A7D4T191_9GAMM|nr:MULTISPECIES: outer membrane lipid asymmetry maintenance protein MlaD [Thiomicrorhabdus]MBO1922960.1 outer membrane lipid asymmetry maintenance protein MlaD [Thiomicrorhabdus sp. 6S3-12]QKI89742.1 outer membrane lipid asymmetry maintenance protein MlaD [Thiomicrorhabdus xiamenensis]